MHTEVNDILSLRTNDSEKSEIFDPSLNQATFDIHLKGI